MSSSNRFCKLTVFFLGFFRRCSTSTANPASAPATARPATSHPPIFMRRRQAIPAKNFPLRIGLVKFGRLQCTHPLDSFVMECPWSFLAPRDGRTHRSGFRMPVPGLGASIDGRGSTPAAAVLDHWRNVMRKNKEDKYKQWLAGKKPKAVEARGKLPGLIAEQVMAEIRRGDRSRAERWEQYYVFLTNQASGHFLLAPVPPAPRGGRSIAAAMAALENEVRIAKERQRAEEERQRRENAEAEIAGQGDALVGVISALMAGKKRKEEEELGGSTGKKQRKL